MLPHQVTFVCSLPKDYPDLYRCPDEEPPDPDFLKSNLGAEVNWVLRTYLILKRKKLNVSIAPKLIPGQICVVAPHRFRIRDYRADSFLVGCRADFARPMMCDVSIVQNMANIHSESDILLPFWPQPALIPRMRERGLQIENMAFKGRSWNLYRDFRSPEFLAALKGVGVHFAINDEHEGAIPDWNDYRTCDLILAVRDLTEQDALVKPPSKLVNAWIAGVPAILGPEPAFRDLRRSPLDYVEVKTPQEALEAIRRLKSRPADYEQMISNGLKRAEEFSLDLIAEKWVDALAGPVAREYERWIKSGSLLRLAKFPAKVIRQKLANRAAEYHRHHGSRMISNGRLARVS